MKLQLLHAGNDGIVFVDHETDTVYHIQPKEGGGLYIAKAKIDWRGYNRFAKAVVGTFGNETMERELVEEERLYTFNVD